MRDPYVLAEEIFELDAGAGFGVAIFDDDSGLERKTVLLAGSSRDGARTRNNDRVFRNDKRLVIFGRVDLSAD